MFVESVHLSARAGSASCRRLSGRRRWPPPRIDTGEGSRSKQKMPQNGSHLQGCKLLPSGVAPRNLSAELLSIFKLRPILGILLIRNYSRSSIRKSTSFVSTINFASSQRNTQWEISSRTTCASSFKSSHSSSHTTNFEEHTWLFRSSFVLCQL